MKGFIYDCIVVLAIFTGLVFGLCGRHFDRHCDHCKEITYYMPWPGDDIVAAKESILDRVLDNYRNGGVYHFDCMNDHDFSGGCDCES